MIPVLIENDMRRLMQKLSKIEALVCFFLVVMCYILTGCNSTQQLTKQNAAHGDAKDSYVVHKVHAVPNLQDSSWKSAIQVDLVLDSMALNSYDSLKEPGWARMVYDDHAIYLWVNFLDRDICSSATKDHQILYSAGDIAEWFIGIPVGPNGEPGAYLELHLAPNGIRSAYRIIRPGLIEKLSTIPFSAEVNLRGTLNDSRDIDKGWTAKLTLPWDSLRESSPEFSHLDPYVFAEETADQSADYDLSVLIARYNYSKYLNYRADGHAGPELSMWPQQPRTSYHLRPFHAPIR